MSVRAKGSRAVLLAAFVSVAVAGPVLADDPSPTSSPSASPTATTDPMTTTAPTADPAASPTVPAAPSMTAEPSPTVSATPTAEASPTGAPTPSAAAAPTPTEEVYVPPPPPVLAQRGPGSTPVPPRPTAAAGGDTATLPAATPLPSPLTPLIPQLGTAQLSAQNLGLLAGPTFPAVEPPQVATEAAPLPTIPANDFPAVDPGSEISSFAPSAARTGSASAASGSHRSAPLEVFAAALLLFVSAGLWRNLPGTKVPAGLQNLSNNWGLAPARFASAFALAVTARAVEPQAPARMPWDRPDPA